MTNFELDSTGFPLVFVPGLSLSAHLLPVTKVQFEEWLVLPNTPGDRFYDEVQIIQQRIDVARSARLGLGLSGEPNTGSQGSSPSNERISWRHCDEDPSSYVRLLVTGILPKEARGFAQWLGEGYDLPTVSEWRAIARSWASMKPIVPVNRYSLAENVWHKLYEVTQPKTLLDQSLMVFGGVMEWVWDDHKKRVLWLGRPHADFYPTTFRPLQYDPPVPRITSGRFWFCGFRLVRRWS
jgi:hypothetical protein